MREIKFRAWDGSRMYYFNNFEWTLDYNDISGWNVVKNLPLGDLKGRKWDAGESSSTAEHFQLMQYTGLDDKNGKEIYEGDIVNVDNSSQEENGEYDVTTTCIWETGQFLLMDQAGGSWTRQLYHQPDRLTVMGNIYENAELLKEFQ